MISCILLAAGLSSRFGSPKALAKINDEIIIQRLQRILLSTDLDQIIVVLGAYADQIKPFLYNHTKIKFVYNKDYEFGQTSSLKMGLRSLSSDVKGVMLLPVDYPLISKETVQLLIDYFKEQKPFILIPTFSSRKGHPPFFTVEFKNEILNLDNSTGLNTLFQSYSKKIIFLPVNDQSVVESFNTEQELKDIISRNII